MGPGCLTSFFADLGNLEDGRAPDGTKSRMGGNRHRMDWSWGWSGQRAGGGKPGPESKSRLKGAKHMRLDTDLQLQEGGRLVMAGDKVAG